MNYTYIPESLLYKRKSLDKFAMQHPLNAVVIKRLMKLEGWNKNYGAEGQIEACLNNAYYICTIMRLEYDATFREMSYQQIARDHHIEGSNTLKECVTLSLVALLVKHSTPHWQVKLQETATDLLNYAEKLVDERVDNELHSPNSKRIHLFVLSGIPKYLSKDIDASWILPDEYFQPRSIDDKAIMELHRRDPTFNWEKYLYHTNEEDIHEIVENLGKTQLEKATLIRSIWVDCYFSRKSFNGPIKTIWSTLKALAQEFCPDCIEITELHKTPDTGLEFEKRISELTEENRQLKEQITQLGLAAVNQDEIDELKNTIASLENDLETFKTQDGKNRMTASQAAIFILTVCHHLGGLPNDKKALSPILQWGWGFSESTSERALGAEAQQSVADKTAQFVESFSPKLGRLIREFPDTFNELRKHKLKDNNDKKLKTINK